MENAKKTYKVLANRTILEEIEIEALNIDQAYELAGIASNDQWTTSHDIDWQIVQAIQIDNMET